MTRIISLMRLPRLFRTSVFRLTLGYLDTQTDAIIEAEINGL
jgi:hypothetical protein